MAGRPLCIDLYCGLGGWTRGFLAEGWDCVGFDIERHVYGSKCYPAQLVLQDVLTLHGSQFRDAACIVASPPCQAYSYRAMPWKRAKALPPPDNSLFEACFRIQREASEAAGHHIPLVVENVKGAQPWVGRARAHFGSYYLWGDVDSVGGRIVAGGLRFGQTLKVKRAQKFAIGPNGKSNLQESGVKQPGHSGRAWFADPDVAGHFSSKSNSRKAASALIAEIPFELASWIARAFSQGVELKGKELQAIPPCPSIES